MDIPTFGALLRFATELEEHYQTAYQEASGKAEDARVKETLLNLAQRNKKAGSQIEKLYRDSIFSDMDVGVQEPIAGLNRADYLDETNLLPDKVNAGFFTQAIQREEKAYEFYVEASGQVKACRPAAGRVLDKLGAEKLERKALLKSLLA